MNELVQLDAWARSVLCDPLSKDAASYGRCYPVTDGIMDFRVLQNETTEDQKKWKEGQREFLKYANSIISDDTIDYQEEIHSVLDTYAAIPIEGECVLDVGGGDGRVRHFLKPEQKYFCCDPNIEAFSYILNQPNLLDAYPCMKKPCNFVCCDAEQLPFRTSSFDVVHMRSVIDHMLSPELALCEAYRVLSGGGVLIVGLLVDGGKDGLTKWDYRIRFVKKIIRWFLALFFKRWKKSDHHIWHPTYSQLTKLITSCGFSIEKVHWSLPYHGKVCYILARKRPMWYSPITEEYYENS